MVIYRVMQQQQYMEQKLTIKLQKLTLKITQVLFNTEYRLKLNGKFLILRKPLENEKRKFNCMSFGKVCYHQGKNDVQEHQNQLFSLMEVFVNKRLVVSENCPCRLCKTYIQNVGFIN